MSNGNFDTEALAGYARQLGLIIEPERLQAMCDEVLLTLGRVRGLDDIDVSEIPLEAAAPAAEGPNG